MLKNNEDCHCNSDILKPENKRITSSNVSIMSSMGNVTKDGTQSYFSLKEYEKAGYQLDEFVEDFVLTDAGYVPKVSVKMSKKDVISTIMVRLGIGRNNYKVTPGLYCVGNPDKDSEVLVTANFKLSFDVLRKELDNINAYILVLDTDGVNVWCAAGKKTFSSSELIKRIKMCALEKIVDHKRVIVPQLGASGVSVKAVKKGIGFSVSFGPVRAEDIKIYLKNKRKTNREMRMVTFNFAERLILTPIEIMAAIQPFLIIAFIAIIISGLGPDIFSFSKAILRGRLVIIALLTGIFSGVLVMPAFLPYIPFRNLAVKGIITGGIFSLFTFTAASSLIQGFLEFAGLSLFTISISSFFAMNFTGTTPFTSPSGVEKEMKQFIPIQIILLVVSIIIWVYSGFLK